MRYLVVIKNPNEDTVAKCYEFETEAEALAYQPSVGGEVLSCEDYCAWLQEPEQVSKAASIAEASRLVAEAEAAQKAANDEADIKAIMTATGLRRELAEKIFHQR